MKKVPFSWQFHVPFSPNLKVVFNSHSSLFCIVYHFYTFGCFFRHISQTVSVHLIVPCYLYLLSRLSGTFRAAVITPVYKWDFCWKTHWLESLLLIKLFVSQYKSCVYLTVLCKSEILINSRQCKSCPSLCFNDQCRNRLKFSIVSPFIVPAIFLAFHSKSTSV